MDTIIASIFLVLFLTMAAAYYRFCKSTAGGAMHFVSTVLRFDAHKKGGEEDAYCASNIDNEKPRPRAKISGRYKECIPKKRGGYKK